MKKLLAVLLLAIPTYATGQLLINGHPPVYFVADVMPIGRISAGVLKVAGHEYVVVPNAGICHHEGCPCRQAEKEPK